MATGEDKKMIKIFVKTPSHKETIEIDEKAKIDELKTLVSTKFNAESDMLCLIFAGKILKDHETLEQHKITDGLTIHLVIRHNKKSESQTSSNESNTSPSTTSMSTNTSSTTTNTTPAANPFSGLMNMGELGNLGRDIFNNPELTSQLFNNPITQELMSNPDNIRALLNMNPEMQSFIERNPEINHILNNNEIFRSSMEMMRNPSAFQEMMRNQDRVLSNLESLPGGYNALRRMYTEIQEPMMNAASEQFGGENPFASFARQNNSNSSSTNVQAGTENRDPLPNPWSRDSSTTNTNSDQQNSTSNAGRGNGMNMFGQLFENHDYMNTILNSPATQQLMQQMISNPELMQRIMANNPLLNLDPASQQQMGNVFQQTMQSPEMRQAMSSPEGMEAIMQIIRGTETLQRVAPNLLRSMMGGNAAMFRNLNLSTTTNTTTTTTTTTTNSSATNTSTSGTNSTTTTTTNQPNMSQLNQMLNQMLAGGLAGSNQSNLNSQSTQPPEELYRNQLEQLNAMGFTNRQDNLNALVECFGDVNRAIEKLLNRGSYFS